MKRRLLTILGILVVLAVLAICGFLLNSRMYQPFVHMKRDCRSHMKTSAFCCDTPIGRQMAES
ncbi:hypothetical protein [Candidatus Soleaferrea massiliensis]|uniref:hypothetical protein n=1 Tax=Candidatus Soleaferrea massiliensis TaxID=1470354 RepID=UPI00058BDE76|nr:hypothetical protein [Candidatus Soleaferrea massiliensis]